MMTEQPKENDHILPEEVIQLPTEFEVAKKTALAKFFGSILQFLNRFKWIIIGVLSLIVVIIVCLYNFISVIPVDKVKLVNLDTTVRIEMGQIVKTKGQNVSVEIIHFTNETCPQGRTCFGSNSKSIEYQITVDGKKYATGSVSKVVKSNYDIETVTTDYKTYADIKVVKIK